MASTLSAHSPKFESHLISFDALQNLPAPIALGPYHKPVPHAVLVDSLHAEIAMRGYDVAREQLAVSKNGMSLFGVMDLTPADGSVGIGVDRGLSFGFRNAVDMSMAIRGVAGSRVFVCDNLALSGETFALSRKNTTRLDLKFAIANGFDKFLAQTRQLTAEITRLQLAEVSDSDAKILIFDTFAAGIVPIRLFDDVERFYFRPTADMTDCTPRTKWGVFNAFTRALRDVTPMRLLGASVALGKRLLSGTPEVIDVTPVSVQPVSYAAEVIADNSGKFCGNALRFATYAEADAYAIDLAMRWTAVRETRVVESSDPVNR